MNVNKSHWNRVLSAMLAGAMLLASPALSAPGGGEAGGGAQVKAGPEAPRIPITSKYKRAAHPDAFKSASEVVTQPGPIGGTDNEGTPETDDESSPQSATQGTKNGDIYGLNYSDEVYLELGLGDELEFTVCADGKGDNRLRVRVEVDGYDGWREIADFKFNVGDSVTAGPYLLPDSHKKAGFQDELPYNNVRFVLSRDAGTKGIDYTIHYTSTPQ